MACDFKGSHHVLLDQQDRDAGAVDLEQRLAQPFDQPGRESERQFVDHQQLRPRHDSAPDGAHLLLAARQRDRVLPLTLAQNRKKREHIVEIAPDLRVVAAQICAEQQVVVHGQSAEQPPPFRDVHDAARQHLIGGKRCDVLAGEPDMARGRRHQPGDRAQQGRLAGAVRSDDAGDLTFLDRQADVPQHADAAITGAQPFDREDRVQPPDASPKRRANFSPR